MKGSVLSLIGRFWLVLILVFLYAPILVMAMMSFNASPFYQLPFKFSTEWYEQMSGNQQIIAAAIRSMLIALATTVIATALGTAASIALFRYEFPGKRVFQVLLFPPIAIPWLITGTAMLIFFSPSVSGGARLRSSLATSRLPYRMSSSPSPRACRALTSRWKKPPVPWEPLAGQCCGA
ncbi:hypothetical protein HORIV_23450 [Vreelandella olivaria]|uniref:ABC transmembrane type-1 domain-containing protein n=1 Tax=Vreelandella olivaria TaxID=390919 RepID=A0ABN5WSH4_9GAMM|nr:hypothetical protein HORIV_23450 [Halomonas olivaria]